MLGQASVARDDAEFVALAWCYRQADEQKKLAEDQRKQAEEQKKLAEDQRKQAEDQKKLADEQRKQAEEQRKQADDILAGTTRIVANVFNQIDVDTRKEAFAVFQAGAVHGNASSMANLGWLYRNGYGVAQDYAKAREWFEKAADKGNGFAMFNLGLLYANGQGVPQDYVKARESWPTSVGFTRAVGA